MYTQQIIPQQIYPQLNNPPIQNEQEKPKKYFDLRDKFPQGITLSWNVDAYIEKKPGCIERIKNCCKKKPVEPSPINQVLDPRLAPYQQQQLPVESQDPNIKQILNKGYYLKYNKPSHITLWAYKKIIFFFGTYTPLTTSWNNI